jgi:hypothetical protein
MGPPIPRTVTVFGAYARLCNTGFYLLWEKVTHSNSHLYCRSMNLGDSDRYLLAYLCSRSCVIQLPLLFMSIEIVERVTSGD